MADLKTLQSDFWLAKRILTHLRNHIFLNCGICARIQKIIKKLFIDQIQKKLMTKFYNKSKYPIFGLFSPFLRQKKFLKKSSSVMHNTTWASNTMLSFRKNWRANPKKISGEKDRRMEGPTHPDSWDLSEIALRLGNVKIVVADLAKYSFKKLGISN